MNIGTGAASYTPLVTDEGALMRVIVTATNAYGQASAISAPAGPVTSIPPIDIAPPTLSGTPEPTDTLSATPGAWSGAGNAYTYQWQHSSDGGATWADIAGAISASYTLSMADDGEILRVLVIATNPDGSVSAASASVPLTNPPSTPVVAPAVPSWTAPPTLSQDAGKLGDRLKIAPGTWSRGAVVTTRVMRCTKVCLPVGVPNARTYTVSPADLGAILRVRETASNAGGQAVVWSTRYVGPVISAQAGAAGLSNAPTALRNSSRRTLAFAQVSQVAVITGPGGRKAKQARGRSITIRRGGNVIGPLTVWACLVSDGPGAGPPLCTAAVSLRKTATLHLPSSGSGQVKVVVVRRRR